MRKGTVLDSARLGILAGLGRAVVDVYRRPKVELIPTGSELVPKESPLRPGKIPTAVFTPSRPTSRAAAGSAAARPLRRIGRRPWRKPSKAASAMRIS